MLAEPPLLLQQAAHGAAQGNAHQLRRLRRILLQVADEVFEPPPPGSPRKEPSSIKKMRQGDASWDLLKEVTGCVIDVLNPIAQVPEYMHV